MNSFLQDYYDFWFGVNDLYDIWAKKRGLTVNEVFVLYIIDQEKGNATQKYICDKLRLPKQTISSLLNGFEKKKYITKRIMPQNHRNKLISFTKEGETFSKKILTKLHELERYTIMSMSQEEQETMQRGNRCFLQHLTACIEKGE